MRRSGDGSGGAHAHGPAFAAATAFSALAVVIVLGWPRAAAAQNISAYFPAGNAGYDQQLGVTVLSRLRPLYEAPPVRIGSFIVAPSLDETLSYNSNVNGTPGSGSWGTRTSGNLGVGSDWVRHRVDASVGFTENQFVSFPSENYLDWHAGLAGGYTIDDALLAAGYSHQTSHSLGTSIGRINSQTPALDQTDSANLTYTFNFGALAITPEVDVSAYRFGPATVSGRTVDQKFLDRNVLAGGVNGRYSLSDEGGLLVVLRGASSDYLHPLADQPSNNSNGVELLAGIDYQGEGVWRWRLLVGVEERSFQASQYATRTAPVTEGGVIWTPTGLTTVTGTISREIEDPESAGTNGAIYTQASLVVDHELLPNVFLQARGSGTYVEYLQHGGGQQVNFGVGAGATWLLNSHARLVLGYDFVKQTGTSNSSNPSDPTTQTTGAFVQHVATLTLHLNL